MIELVLPPLAAVQGGREDLGPRRIEVQRASARAKAHLRRVQDAGGIGGRAAGRGPDVDDADRVAIAGHLDNPQAIGAHRDHALIGERQRATAVGADDQAAIDLPGRAQARYRHRALAVRRRPQPAVGATQRRRRGLDQQRTERGIADDHVIGAVPVHRGGHVADRHHTCQRLRGRRGADSRQYSRHRHAPRPALAPPPGVLAGNLPEAGAAIEDDAIGAVHGVFLFSGSAPVGEVLIRAQSKAGAWQELPHPALTIRKEGLSVAYH
ncbi:hypothetical protein D9M68_655210 [compost metagenome]|uniref:Uncharacterized protein n=1 Tax=Achromobacter agilis TaxID=1353888 RepID=A0A446CVE7_9BURK|nr:hypothetical protein AGI3411_05324 [Achromobacter agilis]